jgi:hypothetical protein
MASSTDLQKLQDEAFLERVRFFEEFLEADKVYITVSTKPRFNRVLNASKFHNALQFLFRLHIKKSLILLLILIQEKLGIEKFYKVEIAQMLRNGERRFNVNLNELRYYHAENAKK